ncbi:folate family ECF transporter S component [Mitsuokella sp. AF21-1AC]|uniref:folate family ECF transporter S component n=1 Tax=Mitsuokella sp. AF21-1AC TaxID=2292235 RepID=UPI000E518CF8|nr:folate family ECF transporter S component [Mitsuokella sp. AF21-1AC]RGS74354.1 folate family ECF transporter S component [Mitsuokella sp. AF21-1AC]
MSRFSVKPLVYAGVSVALAVLLSYVFAVQTVFVRITFGFLPIAIYGAMYGPMKAGLVAAAADFIGTALLGTSIFFPGFLVSGFLTGYIYGWFFYRRRVTLLRACIPFFLVMVFIHLGLNTLWLTIFYHKAASAIFLSRLIKNLLCYPMEVGLFLMVYRPLLRFLPEQFPQPQAETSSTSAAA